MVTITRFYIQIQAKIPLPNAIAPFLGAYATNSESEICRSPKLSHLVQNVLASKTKTFVNSSLHQWTWDAVTQVVICIISCK